jgi:hypothetical protein
MSAIWREGNDWVTGIRAARRIKPFALCAVSHSLPKRRISVTLGRYSPHRSNRSGFAGLREQPFREERL